MVRPLLSCRMRICVCAGERTGGFTYQLTLLATALGLARGWLAFQLRWPWTCPGPTLESFQDSCVTDQNKDHGKRPGPKGAILVCQF
jgi:hypothetical protein